MKRPLILVVAMVVMAVALAACGETETIVKEVTVPGETIIVQKEVVKEVPVEVVVVKEVIKEVKVPGETVVVTKEVEVIREIQVPAGKGVIGQLAAGVTVQGEAPTLAQLVLAGELPPVAERVGSEPLVIPVFGEIGRYGGTMRRMFTSPGDLSCSAGRVNGNSPLRWNTAGNALIPFVIKSLTPNSDASEWTFKLRKGMRWSDGAPFTADDWVFQTTDVHGNDDIKPGKQPWYKGPYDTPIKASKVDDTTVKMTFPGPNYAFRNFMGEFSCTNFNQPHAPMAYLKQFHAEFNPDAEKVAKAAGFEGWVKYFLNREDPRDNVDRPTTRAYLFMNTRSEPVVFQDRNPYFVGVDPAGNQLPYIDHIRLELTPSIEVLMLKAIQGELDFQARHVNIRNFPVLKENEEKGGYTVKLAPVWGGVDAFVPVNQSMVGELGDIMRNKTFRLGLAAAIDREFIIKTVLYGLGNVRNAIPALGHPHHPGPMYEKMHLVYDVDLANKLLDEVLPNKGLDGFRVLPSGESFTYVIGASPALGPWDDMAEIVQANFQAVGINAKANIGQRGLITQQWKTNKMHARLFLNDRTPDIFSAPWRALPLRPGTANWAPAWGDWFISGGEKGIEPPDEMKQLEAWWREGLTKPPEESAKLAQKIYAWISDNQVQSGIVGQSPMIMGVTVVSNELGNLPEVWANDGTFNTPFTAFPSQFYFKE